MSYARNEFVEVFNISTERLDSRSLLLHEGQGLTCTFALDLHLGPGTYHVSCWIHRDDAQKEYDHWESAETFITSISLPYTFFLLNGDMECYRDRHLLIEKIFEQPQA